MGRSGGSGGGEKVDSGYIFKVMSTGFAKIISVGNLAQSSFIQDLVGVFQCRGHNKTLIAIHVT